MDGFLCKKEVVFESNICTALDAGVWASSQRSVHSSAPSYWKWVWFYYWVHCNSNSVGGSDSINESGIISAQCWWFGFYKWARSTICTMLQWVGFYKRVSSSTCIYSCQQCKNEGLLAKIWVERPLIFHPRNNLSQLSPSHERGRGAIETFYIFRGAQIIAQYLWMVG
jgi:hypothetical protein